MKVLSGVIDRLKNPNAGGSKPATSGGAGAGAATSTKPVGGPSLSFLVVISSFNRSFV